MQRTPDKVPGLAVPGAFDTVTAVAPSDPHDVSGCFEMAVDPGWTVGDSPNGGYLLRDGAAPRRSTLASVEGPEHPHPVTATAHYLASPAPVPAEALVEVLRRGRRMSQARARLVRGGLAQVEATFTPGRHDTAAEPWWSIAPRRSHPRERGRAQGVGPGGMALPIMERVHVRLDPAVVGFTAGRPSGRAECGAGWPSPTAARPTRWRCCSGDSFPPATFELATPAGCRRSSSRPTCGASPPRGRCWYGSGPPGAGRPGRRGVPRLGQPGPPRRPGHPARRRSSRGCVPAPERQGGPSEAHAVRRLAVLDRPHVDLLGDWWTPLVLRECFTACAGSTTSSAAWASGATSSPSG